MLRSRDVRRLVSAALALAAFLTVGAQQVPPEPSAKRPLSDADKLLKLANELKVEVDKTSKHQLSVTVIKKSTELEKLAHEIRIRTGN